MHSAWERWPTAFHLGLPVLVPRTLLRLPPPPSIRCRWLLPPNLVLSWMALRESCCPVQTEPPLNTPVRAVVPKPFFCPCCCGLPAAATTDAAVDVPPLGPPSPNIMPARVRLLQENREYTAEVMFETYNVPGLYIAVQAVLALAASWTSKKVCVCARPPCACGVCLFVLACDCARPRFGCVGQPF